MFLGYMLLSGVCCLAGETVKCLLLFVYTHNYNITVWFWKKENKLGALFVFSISANCFYKRVTKINCNSENSEHTDIRVISIEILKCLLLNVSPNQHDVQSFPSNSLGSRFFYSSHTHLYRICHIYSNGLSP